MRIGIGRSGYVKRRVFAHIQEEASKVAGSANKIVTELLFFPEKAELLYNNIRYILIRPETLIGFQKLVEAELGPMTAELMFKAAYDVGSSIGRRLIDGPARSLREMITSMLDAANELGWAKLSLKETNDFPSMIVLEAFNSAFASAYSQSSTPVCHLIRGIFSGALAQMVGPIAKSREIQCLAMGSPKCIFEFTMQER